MSTALPIENTAGPVLKQIRLLRRRMRGWILVDGLARLMLVAVALALIDMVLDRTFRMDYPQRLIMLVLMLSIVAAVVASRLVRPLLAPPSDDALVLEVEKKQGDRGQSMISGFQLSRASAAAIQGMSPSLVQATIEEGNRRAQSVDFTTALNRTTAAQNRLLLGTAMAAWAVIGLGAVVHPFLQTWFLRNIMLADRQWPQATYLEIVGAENGMLTLDRGADYDLRVVVSETSRVRDVPVAVEFESGSNRSSQGTQVTGRLDGREHQLTLHSVQSEFRLRAQGGDAATPWVDVRLVDPIDVRQLNLTVLLPSYAGDSSPLMGSGPHTVLAGSGLRIEVESNLPVASARLKWNEVQSGDASSGGTFDAQYELSRIDDTHFASVLPMAGDSRPLRGGKYSLELLGADGRKNFKPIAFQIAIVEDQPPRVSASLSGIGGLVVPRARVPISFKADDRYGLVASAVEYQWKTGDENAAPTTGTSCERLLRSSDLSWGAAEQEFSFAGAETLELEPLAIPPGEVLRFAVRAQDNQPSQPGIGRSREFLLRVVTEEELRADLLRREIEQRAQFQQERSNQLQLLTDLRALLAAMNANPSGQGQLQQTLIEFQNRQKTVGTNLFQIAQRFSEFLEEAKNNRLDESEQALGEQMAGQAQSVLSLETRYAERIISPIRALDSGEIYWAGQALEAARAESTDPSRCSENARQSAELQETIVKKMDAILAAMEDSQTYQEIVNQVIALKRLEQGLLDSIKTKQGTPVPNDIFDPPGDRPRDKSPEKPNSDSPPPRAK